MNILVDKIRIKNFRVLQDIEVSLKPITLLVGANNSGKTTLLRALNSVLGFSRNQINKDDLFVDKDGQIASSNKIIIDIKIIPVDEQGNKINNFDTKWNAKLGGGGIQSENDTEFFAFRTVYQFDIEDSPSINYQLITNWPSEQLNPDEFKGISQIRNNIKMYFIDAQRDIIEDSKQRTSFFGKLVAQLDYGDDLEEIKKQIALLNTDAIEKSKVLKHLKEELKKLNQTTQTKGEGVSLSPFSKKVSDLHKGMKVYFQDNESDTFSMENHGMGTRSWASIITAGAFTSWQLQQIENKISKGEDTELLFPIFALEEPEAHLHPNAQRTLYKQLKSFKGQKIISTHSPYIAGQAELDELRHLYKNGDSSMVSEIDLSILDRKNLLRIKESIYSTNGDVLFSNLVVMCEGETEDILLPIFANAYFQRPAFELGIDFIATGKHYALLTLLRFLKTKWLIFSDYDKEDVKSALHSVLRKNNVTDESSVIKLNDEITQKDIEEYLYDCGYESEFKEALKKLKEPDYVNENHRLAKQNEVQQLNNEIDEYAKEQVLSEVRNWKTKAARIYGNKIIARPDQDKIPPKVRELFDKISEHLNIKTTDND